MRTYVEVELFGLPGDPKRRYRTKLSPTANSINPVWKEEPFIFEKVLEMGLALVSVPSSWPVPVCLTILRSPKSSNACHGLILALSETSGGKGKGHLAPPTPVRSSDSVVLNYCRSWYLSWPPSE